MNSLSSCGQIGFAAVLYPSCLFTYAGQTAYLIRHPMDHRNAFFKSIPEAVYWPLFILATLAAIVASQSLITATFSIMKQTIALGCFPRVKMVHTSPDQEGQVYSPEVNYVLMVLCVAVVLGFRSATRVGNAFGKIYQIFFGPLVFYFFQSYCEGVTSLCVVN
jgi:KUP system potassium uptake protein